MEQCLITLVVEAKKWVGWAMGQKHDLALGKYVVELTIALASMPGVYRDDLLTRQIVDFFIALFRVDFTGRGELAQCQDFGRVPKNLLERVSQLHWPFVLPERLKADNTVRVNW
ncbi:hypothetical protein Tco_0320492 [Tanacetum coccineum]